MKYTDFYGLLELSSQASLQEIRKAYRQQAKRYHPDTHPGDRAAEKQFKAIQEAYEVLSDPEKRARFDQLTRKWDQYQSFEDVVEDLQQESEAEDEPIVRPRQDADALFEANFGNFYETFFGEETQQFWRRHGKEQPAPPPSQEEASADTDTADDFCLAFTTEISLEEVLKGCRRRIQVHEGVLKTVDVDIPPGVLSGEKVQVPKEIGNFELVVQVQDHPVFTAKAYDLHRDLQVMEYEALLGTKKTVATLSGALQMNIPAESSVGKVFRVRGHGLPQRTDPTVRGDLYVHLQVAISQQLTAAERSLIQQFRDLRESCQTAV